MGKHAMSTGRPQKEKKVKPQKKNRKTGKPSKIKTYWRGLKKWQRVTIVSVASVLAVLIVVGSIAGGIFTSLVSKIQRDDDFSKLDNSALGFDDVIDKNIYNIALFGIDTRKVGDFSGNSDSIMILSINKSQNVIKLISVMRDSLVPIDKDGKEVADKLNSAYALGGPTLAVKTLNEVFGLDISEYATVNFFGMIDIIEAVGGIDATITKGEITKGYTINDHIMEECKSLGIDYSPYLVTTTGTMHLNGIQAVAYARVRYSENWLGSTNDFGRTERQRYVMEQLLNKGLAMDVTAYPSLVSKLAPYVKTSFSNSELIGLASYLVNRPTMITSRIPLDDYIIDSDFRETGASAIYYNCNYAKKVLHAFLYDGISPDDYIAQNGVDKTDWYKSSSKPSSSTSSATSTPSTPSSPTVLEPPESRVDTDSSEPTTSKPDKDTSSGEESSGSVSEGATSSDPSGSDPATTSSDNTPSNEE